MPQTYNFVFVRMLRYVHICIVDVERQKMSDNKPV